MTSPRGDHHRRTVIRHTRSINRPSPDSPQWLERSDVVGQPVGDLDRGIDVVELRSRPALGDAPPRGTPDELARDGFDTERLPPLLLRRGERRERGIVQRCLRVLCVEADLEHDLTVLTDQLRLVVLASRVVEPHLETAAMR